MTILEVNSITKTIIDAEGCVNIVTTSDVAHTTDTTKEEALNAGLAHTPPLQNGFKRVLFSISRTFDNRTSCIEVIDRESS